MVWTNCAMPAGDRSIDGGSRSGSGSRPRQRSEPVAFSLACNFDLNVIFGAKFSGYNPPVPQTTMQVTLPEMGESVTEGTIAKWLKQPGDQVREGEGLVEVTTDKVDAEVPAPASGTLVKILAEAGKTVAVGSALAEIAVGGGGAAAAEVTEGAELLAKAKGIDLATIKGRGPGGSIRRRDVAEAIETQQQLAEKASTPPPPVEKAPAPAQSPTGSIPLRGAAGALVKYMEESLQVPTATSFRTVRVDVLDQRRRQLGQSIQAAGRPEKISSTHLIAFAITRAVKDVPSMAVTFDRVDGNPARVARGVHLGLAVDPIKRH